MRCTPLGDSAAAVERGRIEPAQAMAAMGMQPQDQAQRRDVIPDDIKSWSGFGTVAGAGSAVRRPTCSTTTSFRSLWAAAATRRTCRYCAGHVTAARVLA